MSKSRYRPDPDSVRRARADRDVRRRLQDRDEARISGRPRGRRHDQDDDAED